MIIGYCLNNEDHYGAVCADCGGCRKCCECPDGFVDDGDDEDNQDYSYGDDLIDEDLEDEWY